MNRPYEALPQAAAPALSWAELNQRWLAQEFASLAGQIGAPEHSDSLPAEALSPGQDVGFSPGFGVHIEQRDLAALFGQTKRDTSPDALPSTGDDGHFIL